MARTEEEIQEELVSTYLKNLDYFKKNDLELYNKIEILSSAINDGLYNERYALDYIKEIDSFDIQELETQKYLYNRDTKNQNKELIDKSSLSKKNIFSNLNLSLYKNYSNNYELPSKKFDLLDNYLQNDMSELHNIFQGIKSSNNYKHVDKMFFLGTLLGTHIYGIIKKISPKYCFIYEEDLEIFRLSLFTTNYEKIASTTNVIYSVMDYENIFLDKLEIFLSQLMQFSNYNIKYQKLNHVNDDIIHKIITKLHLSNTSTFDYTKVLYDTVYSFSKNIHKNKILTLGTLTEENKNFNNKAVLFVGAGPSLSKNISWIKENQDKFIIVAMGATYKKLFDNEIKVDIVTTVEQQFEALYNSYFNDEDIKLLKDTIILASVCTPQKIVEKFNKEKLFLFETYQSFKENSKAYNGASVGEVTLSILLDMNIKNIYLLGIDLSINEETGSTHYEGYKNQKEALSDKSKVNELLKSGKASLSNEYLEVKGLTKEKVITSRIFSLSIIKYTEVISQFKKEWQTLYNLSNDAAYIQGMDYLDINGESLKSIKPVSKEDILTELNTLAEEGLNLSEVKKLENRVEDIHRIIQIVEDTFSSSTSKNIYHLNDKLEKVIKPVLEMKDYTCSNLIGNYFNFSLPYIFNSLNDEKLKSKVISRYFNDIESVLKNHIIKILEAYAYFISSIK